MCHATTYKWQMLQSKVSFSNMSVYVSAWVAPREITTTCTYRIVTVPTVFVICTSVICVVLCEYMEEKSPLW